MKNKFWFHLIHLILTNFEIQKYYENEPKFNVVFSRDNLPKTKNGTYVINLDEYADIGTHWIALFCRKTEVEIKNYRNKFDSFGLEHVSEETKEFVGNKSIKANIFRAQANYSIMCGSYCIGFIDFMLAGKKICWSYKFAFSLWFWKKMTFKLYNFELFQGWMKLIK